MAERDLAGLASEAFFYGYPLVADVDEVVRFHPAGMGSVPAAPFNQFSTPGRWPARRTRSSPSTTTRCTRSPSSTSAPGRCNSASLTPATHYVLQFIDTWTNNFAYVGTRASGLVGPVLPGDATGLGWPRYPAATPRSRRPPGSPASWAAGPAAEPATCPPCTHSRTSYRCTRPAATPPGPGCPKPAAGPRRDGVLREAADLAAGLPAHSTGSRLPAAVRTPGPARSGLSVPGRGQRPGQAGRSPG